MFLKSLSNILLSPISANNLSSNQGVTTIQALGETDRFVEEIKEKISYKSQAEFNSIALTGWLGFNLGNIAACILGGIAFLSVWQV